MLKRKGLWIIVAFLLMGSAFIIGKKKQHGITPPVATASTASQAPVLEFLPDDVIEVVSADIQKKLTVSGALRALNQASVKARVAGEVSEVLVREGEAVQQGQILARMNTSDYLAKLAQARGALSAAQGQLDIARQARDNNRALLDKHFISQSAYDNTNNQLAIASANVESARGALEVAQKALADTVVRAPISGMISSRSVQPGEKVSPDNRLLDIVDLRVLEMEAPVPTQDISSVRLEQSVELQIEGVSEKVTGKVSRINPATAPGSRSIMIYVQVENRDQTLRAGMFAEAQLVTDKRNNVLTLPQTAIQYEGDKAFVYAIENNILLQKPVTLGLQGSSNGVPAIQVNAGLRSGTKVVKANLGSLRAGLTVRFVKPVQQPAQPVQSTQPADKV
ncbi:MAG: efflux RND transporter periplasmic adaptor subunit [Burkholderiales bacterium]|nr:efflux RND transporter periplasmic adaptor subunit [Burkholderiales bacterium]